MPLELFSVEFFMNDIDFTRLLARITHLAIGSLDVPWERLAQIPKLTHLSVSEYNALSSFQAALTHCKSVEVLVVVCETRARREACVALCAALAADPRLVVLVVADYRHNWERGARGGEDHWLRAEAVVRDRRVGETECRDGKGIQWDVVQVSATARQKQLRQVD
ncbi:hypothetical protein C8R44DRAFT_738153 [Mycena epipterygia]|nr:hypothetical protein C8R44DRAFT_738153 [Mycena epipterygia]